eukprot:1280329-Prymnesium_polylepis.1
MGQEAKGCAAPRLTVPKLEQQPIRLRLLWRGPWLKDQGSCDAGGHFLDWYALVHQLGGLQIKDHGGTGRLVREIVQKQRIRAAQLPGLRSTPHRIGNLGNLCL